MDEYLFQERAFEYAQFLKLEPSAVVPKVGDRVLVACGFLGMGHFWVREEAVVLECGDTSYKVRFTNYKHAVTGQAIEKWAHQNLITDVIAAKAA